MTLIDRVRGTVSKSTLGGYGEFSFSKYPGSDSAFDARRFVLFLYSPITDRISLATELEWEHGGTQYDKPAAYEQFNPVNHVAKWATPMLVVHSEKDFRIPYEQGLAAFTALQRRGIDSQFLVFPDENHWVLKPHNSVQWHDTVLGWLKRWTGGAVK